MLALCPGLIQDFNLLSLILGSLFILKPDRLISLVMAEQAEQAQEALRPAPEAEDAGEEVQGAMQAALDAQDAQRPEPGSEVAQLVVQSGLKVTPGILHIPGETMVGHYMSLWWQFAWPMLAQGPEPRARVVPDEVRPIRGLHLGLRGL